MCYLFSCRVSFFLIYFFLFFKNEYFSCSNICLTLLLDLVLLYMYYLAVSEIKVIIFTEFVFANSTVRFRVCFALPHFTG